MNPTGSGRPATTTDGATDMTPETITETTETTETTAGRATDVTRDAIPAVLAQDRLSCRVHLSRRAPAPGRSRPLFVMVHGIGMSHRYYDKLQRKLIEHGDTLILDLPGFGGTATPDRPLGVGDYAVLIAQALDEEGARGCVVIGHSMGAQFSTELAISRPDLVSHLVLIGPVTDVEHRSPIKHALMLATDTLVERPVTNLMVATAYAQCGIPWYLQELPVMLGYRLDDRLPLVTCPVLVLRGTLDIIAGRDWCEKLSSNARRGRLVQITGQPHAAHRGGAATVATAVLDLVHDHPSLQAPSAPGAQEAASAGGPTHADRSVRSYPLEQDAPARTVEMRGITVQDRQCRSYVIGHSAEKQRTDPGEGPAPVFVLIHGIGMSHRYFHRLGSLLSAHGEVHLIDLPGYGWTKRPAHASTTKATAELVGALLDEAGVSSCVVVGHSMGAQSATELALERPDLVSHLVLIGAAVDAERRTVHQQALTLGINSVLEKPLLSMVQFFDVLRCGPRWYLAQLELAMGYPLEDRLPLAHQPVLVLRGSRDIVAGDAWSRRLARGSRRGEASMIDGAPHAAHHSAPDAVAAAVIGFLGRGRAA
ncbi:alpha/beta fold hydrolase [Arthrobacter sp. B0490]|uniref:alpha/beta fold hydrolase n=1 Tax=Arthrobacter sp. B0490 TaxID=2058891 RepID=UPI000CE3677D|nr:alpha/beta hydrolase [Arthrobacter sp. B0490]